MRREIVKLNAKCKKKLSDRQKMANKICVEAVTAMEMAARTFKEAVKAHKEAGDMLDRTKSRYEEMENYVERVADQH